MAEGGEPTTSEPVALDALLEETAATWRRERPGFSAELKPMGGLLQAPTEQLRSVLDHLVQNAFDAAGSEGHVALRARLVGNSALIEVEDDGPGMDLDFVRQKLFRPFHSTGSTGFGIGAYQIREYVRSMGGRLEVRTAPGMGTTMQVSLPLVTSDHEGASAFRLEAVDFVNQSGQAILLVEDDAGLQKQMQWSLSDYKVLPANDRASALTIFRRETPRVVILDLGLPPLPDEATEGLALLEAILTQQPATKIIVASGQDRTNAIRAIGLGAYDFFAKPIDPDVLLLMIGRAFHLLELEDENRKLQRASHGSPFDGVIAGSPQMLDVCRMVERVAPSNVSVLLLGESGTGKELLARALHTLNPRSAKRFVAINCAAIPETLLESELFGYERGAFTGATKQTLGMIEHAHGGTLFLDEIADMPLAFAGQAAALPPGADHRALGGPRAHRCRYASCVGNQSGSSAGDQPGPIPRGSILPAQARSLSKLPPLREREGDAVLIAKAMLDRLRSIRRPGKDAEPRMPSAPCQAMLGPAM